MLTLLAGSTKGAMDMLTKVMALELGPHNVSPAGVPPITQPACQGSLAHFTDPCLCGHRSA